MNYSKVGCIQCKKVHQKCDEKVPECDRCIRKSLDCQYNSNFIIKHLESAKDKNSKVNKTKKKTKMKFSAFIPVDNSNPTCKIYISNDDIKKDRNNNSNVNKIINKEKNDKAFESTDKTKFSKDYSFASFDKLESYSNSPSFKTNNFLQFINNDSNSTPTPTPTSSLSEISSLNMHALPISNNDNNKDTPSNYMYPNIIESTNTDHNVLNSSNSNSNHSETKKDGLIYSESSSYLKKDSEKLYYENNNKDTNDKNEINDINKNEDNEINIMPHITLEDLVKIMPTDLDFFNMMDIDGDNYYSLNDTYIPFTSSFEVSWENSVTVDFLGIFQKHDPIQTIYAENNDVSLKDDRLLNFIWTLNKGTRHYFNFPMYPLEIYIEVLDYCTKLNEIYPIIQSVMTYDCAMLLTGIYKCSNKMDLFLLWDRQIRIPSFKQCLDILKERIDSVNKFSESVVLTFVVIIIFSANSSDESWMTHLRGSYQLFLKSSSLQSSIDLNDEYDYAASKIFEVVKEWFFNTEFLSQVSSNKGFKLHNNTPSEFNNFSEDSIAILDNGLSLIGGHSIQLKPIFLRIQDALSYFENKGVYLSGNNLLVFRLTNSDKGLAAEVKSVGFEILMELKELKYKYKRSKIHDYQMEFTLKNGDKLARLSLELYISYFFIGNKTADYYVELLEQILETIYSMPYYSTACIYCQWSIYLSALVSLLHEKEELYNCFYKILYSLRQNGMYVTENSLTRLVHIKKVIETKEYEKLIACKMDYMLI